MVGQAVDIYPITKMVMAEALDIPVPMVILAKLLAMVLVKPLEPAEEVVAAEMVVLAEMVVEVVMAVTAVVAVVER